MKLKNIFSNLFGPSRAQLEHKVATLIAEGKIPEAIQALLDAGHPEAALLKAQWDALMLRQQTEPNLDWETFTITQNRIVFALLELTKHEPGTRNHAFVVAQPGPKASLRENPEQDNPEPANLTEEQRAQLRQLLDQDQWQQALELGKDWNHEMTLTYLRYQNLERNHSLGLVTEATYQSTQRQISDALRYFVQ